MHEEEKAFPSKRPKILLNSVSNLQNLTSLWISILECLTVPELATCGFVSGTWRRSLFSLPAYFWRRQWRELSSEDFIRLPSPPCAPHDIAWNDIDRQFSSFFPPLCLLPFAPGAKIPTTDFVATYQTSSAVFSSEGGVVPKMVLLMGYMLSRQAAHLPFLCARFGLDKLFSQHVDKLFSQHPPQDTMYEACRCGQVNVLARAYLKYTTPEAQLFSDFENHTFPDGRGQEFTAIIVAVANKQLDALRYLLRVGTDPENDRCCWRPLQLASEQGWEEGVSELLKAKADANAREVLPRHGHASPFYLAMSRDHLKVAQLLLDHKADPLFVWQPYRKYAPRQLDPHNALTLACAQGRRDSIEFLLTSPEARLDPSILTAAPLPLIPSHSYRGIPKSPLQRAKESGSDILDLLLGWQKSREVAPS